MQRRKLKQLSYRNAGYRGKKPEIYLMIPRALRPCGGSATCDPTNYVSLLARVIQMMIRYYVLVYTYH